jgi:hypothetical protein
MSNDPFSGNPNYTNLFKLRNNVSRCPRVESVELYKHKTKDEYAIFHYIVDNGSNIMPVRLTIKFTEMVYVEVEQTPTQANLYIITTYKDINMISQKMNLTCSDLAFALQVERELYKWLL